LLEIRCNSITKGLGLEVPLGLSAGADEVIE
jgi:hypothetical protein